MILVDTNIPLRITQPSHPHHPIARDALKLIANRDSETFGIAPQSLYEMYVVCTRPIAANGLGMTGHEALNELIQTRSTFTFLPESARVYFIWEDLLKRTSVFGKRAHDLRLVALMIDHSVQKILTFNDSDFRSIAGVVAVNPFDVLAIARF